VSAIELVKGMDALRPRHLEPGCLPRKSKEAKGPYESKLRHWPFMPWAKDKAQGQVKGQ
jgi:hypothetical protein